ncbi:MAG: hypothetical protein WCS30_01750 [Selenomonadaceae bacterium]
MSTDVNVISLSSQQAAANTKATTNTKNSSSAVKSTKRDNSADNTRPDKGKNSFDDVLETAKESKKTDTSESKAVNKEVKTPADKDADTSAATDLATMQQQSVVINPQAVPDGKTVLAENPVISALLKAEAVTGTAASNIPATSGQKQSVAG